jgi:hypothetical protein
MDLVSFIFYDKFYDFRFSRIFNIRFFKVLMYYICLFGITANGVIGSLYGAKPGSTHAGGVMFLDQAVNRCNRNFCILTLSRKKNHV